MRPNNEITTPIWSSSHITSLPAKCFKALTRIVCICNSDTYIGAETYYNLFTVRKNSDAATDEDRVRVCIFLCVLRSVNFVYGCVTRFCLRQYACVWVFVTACVFSCWCVTMSVQANNIC